MLSKYKNFLCFNQSRTFSTYAFPTCPENIRVIGLGMWEDRWTDKPWLFAQDTEVATEEAGCVKVADLKEGDKVLSQDNVEGSKLVYADVTNATMLSGEFPATKVLVSGVIS